MAFGEHKEEHKERPCRIRMRAIHNFLDPIQLQSPTIFTDKKRAVVDVG